MSTLHSHAVLSGRKGLSWTETEAVQEVFVEGRREEGNFEQDLKEGAWRGEAVVGDMYWG